MPELTIDGNAVDLGTSRLVFSKKGYSFEDWLTKDIPYSERITLPETSLLNSIFFRPFSQDIQGQKFSKFHNYKYRDNGKIVSSGIAKLEGFNESRQYELQLLDGSFALFQSINDNISALDFESSDFIFGTSSYTAMKVLNASVWIWAASSMHEEKTLSRNILGGNISFSRPYLSTKRLLEKIFLVHGWSYDLNTDSDLFDKLIISARSDFLFTSYEKSFSGSQSTGNIDLTSPIFIKRDSVTSSVTLNLTYDSVIRFRGNIDADNDFILQLTVTGTDAQIQTLGINKGLEYYDLYSNDFKAGSAVTISVTGTGSIEFDNFLIYTIIDENDFGIIGSAAFNLFKVKTYDNLPEISQKELFKHLLVSIGGFFTTNNFNKKITISALSSLSRMSAMDWSTKFIDQSESVSLLSGYGKTNYYNYNNSREKLSNLGRGSFIIVNETLDEVENIYDSIFAASLEVEITDTMIDNTIYNNTERIEDVNTLLGYYENISDYTVARFGQLNGNNILANYYVNFLNAVKKGEMIECKFNLNKSDFFLFDFTRLVYLLQKKSVFYVLKIGNYTDGKLTDVTLLKT